MNPTTNTEAGAVADVAAELTEAQRAQIVAQPRRIAPERARTLPAGLAEFAGYTAPRWKTRWRLTPLGIAVRQHLEQGATAGVVGGKE